MARKTSYIGVTPPDVALQSALEKVQASAQTWVTRTAEGFQRGWYAYYQVAYPIFVRVASMINARGGKQALKAPVRGLADVARNYATVGAPFAYGAHLAGRMYKQMVAQGMPALMPAPLAPPAMPAPAPAPAPIPQQQPQRIYQVPIA